jgi:glycolate oxidase
LLNLGGTTMDQPGYDLVGAFVGSEGTFGIITKVTLRVIKKPETTQVLMAAFNSSSEAGAAVSNIIASGMFPAAMEIMDRLALEAAEAAVHANYPNCQALLLVELDGSAREVELADGKGRTDLQGVRGLGDAPGEVRAGTNGGVERS